MLHLKQRKPFEIKKNSGLVWKASGLTKKGAGLVGKGGGLTEKTGELGQTICRDSSGNGGLQNREVPNGSRCGSSLCSGCEAANGRKATAFWCGRVPPHPLLNTLLICMIDYIEASL